MVRVVGRRVLRMLLLACSAGYVMYVDYLSHGIQPLFVAMLLGTTSWTGYFLWEDPNTGGAVPPGRGEGLDEPGRGGVPDVDPAGTDRAGATRAATRSVQARSSHTRPARGARAPEKVLADVE